MEEQVTKPSPGGGRRNMAPLSFLAGREPQLPWCKTRRIANRVLISALSHRSCALADIDFGALGRLYPEVGREHHAGDSGPHPDLGRKSQLEPALS